MSFLPAVAGHAGVEHATASESWSHYLSDGRYALIAAAWIVFLLLQASVRRCAKNRLRIGFAAANIAGAVLLSGNDLLAGLVLSSAGFALLAWTVADAGLFRRRSAEGKEAGRGR